MIRSEQKISTSKLILYWFAVWTALSLLQTIRLYYAYNVYDTVVSWQRAAIWAFAEWYLWGILSIFIIKVIQWLDKNNKSLRIKISSFLLGLVFIPPLHLYLYSAIWLLTKNIYPAPIGTSYTSVMDIFVGSYLGKVNDNSVAYFLLVAAIYAFIYYKRLFLEQKRLAEVNKLLVEAKLEQLKTQLQPHFLFNTLNTITSLIHSDPNKADLMTTKLSDLLRISLNSESIQEVTINQEVSLIKKYLDIQKIRFEDRIEIHIDITEESEKAYVPYFILQPIVENIIKHAVEKSSDKVTITISSINENNNVILSVTNTGSSLSDEYETIIAERTGLQNSIKRLKQLYQDSAQFEINNAQPSGVIVKLTIPLHFKANA